MRITHVVPHIDEEASGPSYSVPRLCTALAADGNAVELKCLAAQGRIPGVRLSVYRQWPMTGKLAVSSELARALHHQARTIDIVHNHSLWSMVNVAAGCVVPGHRAKLVTSPRGTLSAWALARSRRIKRLMRPLQWPALTRADLLHATSETELAEIRALGLCAPVAVIPNGVDVPPPRNVRHDGATRTVLFLSRIHPKKGIDELLRAWQQVEGAHADWRLVVAGKGEPAHVARTRQLAASLGVQRVEFPGPLYGDDKSTAYFQADLFVLPTHSENFGLVVAEALAHGCPAIVSHGAPWPGLAAKGCGWWVDGAAGPLADALDSAMQLTRERLAAMGARGRAWMEHDFSWPAIGHQMGVAYRWLLDGGAPPEHVFTDPGRSSDHTVSGDHG